MNDKRERTPTVFVLMPFDTEFRAVYDSFVAPTLREVGFDVIRADDIRSQRNILQDVAEAIRDADLIIADVTGGNENVYYELGLSHGLGKPVVLMTQDVSELPFDLRAYRHVEYSVHFDEIGAARDTLRAIAEGSLDGSVRFGSPVSDYLGETVSSLGASALPSQVEPKESLAAPAQSSEDSDEDWGFFDHMAELEEGFSILNEVLGQVNSATQKVGDLAARRSSQWSEAESTAEARRIAREYAKEVDDFAATLRSSNEQYRAAAARSGNSLEFLISFMSSVQTPGSKEEEVSIAEQISSIASMRDAAIGGRAAFAELGEVMRSLPRIERHLNRALKAGAEEVDVMVKNIDLTIASADRALAVAREAGLWH